MKILHLSTALSAAVLSFVPSWHARAGIFQTDHVCFMTTQSGQVVNLSDSLCKSNKSPSADSASGDEAFIEEYKRKLMAYPDDYSGVRDNLLESVEQSPDLTITQAKSVCNDLEAGLTLEEIKQNQAGEIVEKAETINAALINNLAPKHYCPEWSDG